MSLKVGRVTISYPLTQIQSNFAPFRSYNNIESWFVIVESFRDVIPRF